MLFNSAIVVLFFANKVVKVQAQKFVRSLYGVPRTLQYVKISTQISIIAFFPESAKC